MNKKLVFLGTRKIGFDCLSYLIDQQKSLNCDLIQVFTNEPKKQREDANIIQLCEKNNIPVSWVLEDFLQLESTDISISVQYHKILKKAHISKAQQISVNLHMAPLPEYRGCNQFSYAIINGDKEFGTTLHRLEEGIDDGAILFEKRFPLADNCWVDELYALTEKESLTLFKQHIGDIIDENYTLTPQEELLAERGSSLNFRKDIHELKKIDMKWPQDKIKAHIRATSMPGFSPPYTFIDGQKIEFVR